MYASQESVVTMSASLPVSEIALWFAHVYLQTAKGDVCAVSGASRISAQHHDALLHGLLSQPLTTKQR